MKTLKQQMIEDLEVFFNLDEFGELHRVEGKEITIIIDEDELAEKKNGTSFDIAEATHLFYARSEDLPKRKGPESSINFDGKECLVMAWNEEKGISEVIIRQNRSS